MAEAVVVRAPSRLHFGMFSFGHATQRQFGGAGVMIDEPALELKIEPSGTFEFVGSAGDRVASVLQSVKNTSWGDAVPPCRVTVIERPRSHVGLGTGTQLAVAVAAGLRAIAGLPPLDAAGLATASGRAKRSAVGLHGFLRGGLIVEAGRLADEVVSPLTAQVTLPPQWRFVLLCPRNEEGLSGVREQTAFATLPAVDVELTRELQRIACDELLPAAKNRDFARFATAVFEFGATAGRCFKSHQAGVYATGTLARLVSDIRASGIAGVGQSSWGPTLFTLHADEEAARRFVDEFRARPDAAAYEITVTRPNAGGGCVDG
jgi:beta-RFAP synthase